MPDSKKKHQLCFHGLEGVAVWSKALSQSGSYLGYNTVFTHTDRRKIILVTHHCVNDKHSHPYLWLVRVVCASLGCSVTFGTQKDISAAAAATFALLMGQRKEAVVQQAAGASKVCTLRTASHQVIIKTGAVASPASWNVYVRWHKGEADQTGDGVIEKWWNRTLKKQVWLWWWCVFKASIIVFVWNDLTNLSLPWCLCVVVWHINSTINHFTLLNRCTSSLTCLFQPAVIFAYHWMMLSTAVNPQLLIFKIFVSRQFSRIWSSAPSRCKWKQERVLRSRHAEHATITYLTSGSMTSLLGDELLRWLLREANECFHFFWLGDY